MRIEIGGYGRRDGLEVQLPSGHIEIAGAGWVHMQIGTLLPHCRYLPAALLTDTVRQLLTAYMRHTNFRLHFRQMLLVIDEHSDVDGRLPVLTNFCLDEYCSISYLDGVADSLNSIRGFKMKRSQTAASKHPPVIRPRRTKLEWWSVRWTLLLTCKGLHAKDVVNIILSRVCNVVDIDGISLNFINADILFHE